MARTAPPMIRSKKNRPRKNRQSNQEKRAEEDEGFRNVRTGRNQIADRVVPVHTGQDN
jgi:hypothetical protein